MPLRASSWDCASALSPQSGKVAAKSNHLVTPRRCEEARRPLEDSRIQVHRTQSGRDRSQKAFTKSHKYSGLMFSVLRHPTSGLTNSNAVVSISQQQLRFHRCGGRVANVAADVKQILQAA